MESVHYQRKKPRMMKPLKPIARNSGFTMLEAMVSIVVLSIGLLGMAGLQAVSLRNTSSANYRGQAAWLAQQMVDEARGRRVEALASSGDLIGALGSFSCTGTPSSTSSLQMWQARIACALPAGQGGTTFTPFDRRLIVTVQWDDSRGDQGSTAQAFTIETML